MLYLIFVRLAGAVGAFCGVEGRRVAGAAPGGGGAAAPAPEAEAGLGRPGGPCRLDPAAAKIAAEVPAGDAGHAAGLAPAAGPLAVDLPSPGGRPPVDARLAALIEQMTRENPVGFQK